MAINPHDDYEALAKLLYPSIEASGNVYYGQTRKLAIDGLFDKNNNGFHAHIESQYNDKSKEYGTFFCWELGPLKGAINVPEVLPTAPMCFAKYKLVFTSETVENDLYFGTYNSYERSVSAVFSSIEKTYGKIPVRNTAWDGANFYIIEEDSVWYLYIAIKYSNIITDLVDPEPYEYTPQPYKDGNEFTITNLSDDTDISVELKLNGSLENTNVYQYFIVDSSSDWVDLVLDTPVVAVGGSKIKFRCRPGVTKSDQTSSNFLKLQIAGANAALSGDFRSLQENKNSVKRFEFSGFLRQNNTIVDAHDLIMSITGIYAFEYLFFTCINLKYPPQLPASTLSHYCYYNMFFGCESLLVAPELPAVNLMPNCYENMFSGCTQLSKVQDYFKVKYLDSFTLAYSFINMFRNCKSLQVAPCIICDSLQATSCNGMFYGCTSLKTARIVVTNNLKDDMYSGSNYKRSFCFKDMFKNCTSLTDVYLECPLYTEFETQYVSVGLCQEMFSGCINLRRIFCYMPQKWISRNDNYTDWLKDVSQVGVFYYDTEYEDTLPLENKFLEGDSGIPSGWERRNIYEKYSNEVSILKFCDEREYVLASGTNNESNGRGDITDPATLANMEKSFDENNNHPMNTYNADGSFNQEIWGYKSFCSPVQFRNGIYGEDWSIYTYGHDNSSNSVIITRGETNSASIQINKQLDFSHHAVTDSVILSSAKSGLASDGATIAVVSNQLNSLSRSLITLQADSISLNGSIHFTDHTDINGQIHFTDHVEFNNVYIDEYELGYGSLASTMTVDGLIIPETTASWLGNIANPWGCVCTECIRHTFEDSDGTMQTGSISVYATSLKPGPYAEAATLGEANSPWEAAYVKTLRVSARASFVETDCENISTRDTATADSVLTNSITVFEELKCSGKTHFLGAVVADSRVTLMEGDSSRKAIMVVSSGNLTIEGFNLGCGLVLNPTTGTGQRPPITCGKLRGEIVSPEYVPTADHPEFPDENESTDPPLFTVDDGSIIMAIPCWATLRSIFGSAQPVGKIIDVVRPTDWETAQPFDHTDGDYETDPEKGAWYYAMFKHSSYSNSVSRYEPVRTITEGGRPKYPYLPAGKYKLLSCVGAYSDSYTMYSRTDRAGACVMLQRIS